MPTEPRVSRRTLLVGAAAVTTATLAGCAPTARHPAAPTPSPTAFTLRRPATLAADGTVPAALAHAALAPLTGVAGLTSVTPAAPDTPTDLLLTYGALPAGYRGAPVGASPAAILTHLRVAIDGVSGDQARGLLGGAIGDWSAVGAPYGLGAQVFTLSGLPTPSGLSLVPGARLVESIAALLDALRATPGSLALAPLEAADWTVRNLGVEGVYPAQGRGAPLAYPFAPFTLTLGASQALVKAGLNVAALAGALNTLLAASQPMLDMAVVGDIMLGRGVNNKMFVPRYARWLQRRERLPAHAHGLAA